MHKEVAFVVVGGFFLPLQICYFLKYRVGLEVLVSC